MEIWTRRHLQDRNRVRVKYIYRHITDRSDVIDLPTTESILLHVPFHHIRV